MIKNKNPLEPKDEKTKARYLEIFEEYKLSGMSQKQIADKYDLSQGHVARIVSYGNDLAYDQVDNSVYRNITLTRLERNMDTLNEVMSKLTTAVNNIQGVDGMTPEEMLLNNPNAIRNITTLMKEVRSTNESVANIMGVMNAHSNAGPAQINIAVPGIQRGEGIDNLKVVNGE